MLIALSALHFVLCLPGLHSDASGEVPGHAVLTAVSAAPADGAAEHSSDAATKSLPGLPHDDCGDSTALPLEGGRVIILLVAAFLGFVVFLAKARRDAVALLPRGSRDAFPRRYPPHRCVNGSDLLNLLCLARL
ncbi:hypothetical protein amrb99_14950 [Actinomadura sp. RB99]|uniref:hypothetical protein n=1 Tax=Actinomadura sp. RB99 TaxID=2691577 RepID=UPI0016867140|nr:hypothetical protein [Actinomadura sp. RB99]MBD2892585.1 hypothetical protein [Actinomadura sp. RB99]